MRAGRLLSTLLLLQNRGRLTAEELAAELEVSVRTVYRDIDALSAAGVPVYAERGRGGGYRLVAGFRTRLTGLTDDEAEALLLSGLPGPAAELGLGTAMAAAQLKLRAALPSELAARVGRAERLFHLDAPGWFREAEEVPYLASAAEAVWQERRMWLRYRRWGSVEVEREVDPLGLVLKAGTWYLVATAENRPRIYRVGRILDSTVLDAGFERPAGFDLAEFWQDRLATLAENTHPEHAVVRLSPRGYELLFLLGPAVVRAAHEAAGPPDALGWVRVQLPIESVRHALHDLLRLGAEVEILDPPELRHRMIEVVARLSGMYR